ncbi:MmcB family DNA repair protein [uncultured Fusobacterium sp.]|uniref:MmcB family DNA repair protein n=1 Tax=uncultured Fusobacterium sp. TaxID=159267 RepID=UPI0025D7778F|nr:MmcB family DNA repair protein [uncultured Fusobacterium sp.]
MAEIKNNNLLDNIEKQITDLISLDKKNWTTFYKLLKQVENEQLWKEKYHSFTQWLKDFSIRNKIHESILWKRKKAGEVYHKYSEIQKEKGIEVKPLESANISVESLVLLDKIIKNDKNNTTELAEKLFNNQITSRELRQIHNSVRENKETSSNTDTLSSESSEKEENKNVPTISTSDMLTCLFETEKWIGAKKEKYSNFSKENKTKIKTLTEFAVYTGTTRHSRRIDLLCAENFNTDIWDLNLHGVEIKVSKGDLLNDCKYTEYAEFVDFLWLAVPKELEESAIQNKFTGCGLMVIDRDKKTDKLNLKVLEKPTKLSPARKEETYKTLILKLIE